MDNFIGFVNITFQVIFEILAVAVSIGFLLVYSVVAAMGIVKDIKEFLK